MLASDAIEVRPYRSSEDKAFVYSTWLRNYKHSSYFAKRIRPVVFFAGHHALLDHLFNKPEIMCAIACSPEDPGQIFGYLAYQLRPKPILHFIFVKDDFRKMGVARTLIKSTGIDVASATFTHWTYPVDDIIRRFPEMIYSPYEM